MKVFFYSCYENSKVPFSNLYDNWDTQTIISNDVQYITEFGSFKDQLMDLMDDEIADKSIFVPIEIKKTFLNWLNESESVDWNKKKMASKPPITQVIGADDLNNFIQEMNVEEEWENVIQPNEKDKQQSIKVDTAASFWLLFLDYSGIIVGLLLVCALLLLELPSLITLQKTQMTAVLDRAKTALKRNNLEEARYWADIRVVKFYKDNPNATTTENDKKNTRNAERILVAINEIEKAKLYLKKDTQKIGVKKPDRNWDSKVAAKAPAKKSKDKCKQTSGKFKEYCGKAEKALKNQALVTSKKGDSDKNNHVLHWTLKMFKVISLKQKKRDRNIAISFFEDIIDSYLEPETLKISQKTACTGLKEIEDYKESFNNYKERKIDKMCP
jgi:hypothetical protein